MDTKKPATSSSRAFCPIPGVESRPGEVVRFVLRGFALRCLGFCAGAFFGGGLGGAFCRGFSGLLFRWLHNPISLPRSRKGRHCVDLAVPD